MIQICSTLNRNLDEINNQHYDLLKFEILGKMKVLRQRQREFIIKHLDEILKGNPEQLLILNQSFKDYCTNPGKGMLKNYNYKLLSVFNYKKFTDIKSKKYCGYDLAKKLDFKTCPYCNRNYTATVMGDNYRILRPDFDHFFPHKKFPLLGLSFYNLIPSCLICNRTIKNQKEVKYGEYIHPYVEGFDDSLKISYLPKNVDSAVGLKSDFFVIPKLNDLTPMKSKRSLNSFKLFKLKEIYEESHSNEISEIIRKHCISEGKYLERLNNTFPQVGSIAELYRLAFNNYYDKVDFEKRPLSKLNKDIFDKLQFSIVLGDK